MLFVVRLSYLILRVMNSPFQYYTFVSPLQKHTEANVSKFRSIILYLFTRRI